MSHSKTHRPIRRTAALLCAAFAGLGLAGRTSAQVSGPLATSPITPTPWESPLYHSGGGGGTLPPTATNAPFLTPLIDPLQNQLQGTPSGLVNGNLTQIPSFLLGNYDPSQPPRGLQTDGINLYYPNHLADGDIYSWSAPFSYVAQGAGNVTIDDNPASPPTAPNGFSITGNFVQITDPVAFPAAGTATGGEYYRLPSGSPGTAVWTLYQPTGGNYSLYFHIPNDLPSATGVAETRDTQVTYFIAVRDANGNVTTTTSATTSQTEANDTQFLAGPFQLVAGGTVTVTLTRNNTINNNVDYLVADSMTLEQAVGDVQSAPTIVTDDLYPSDFTSTVHPLQYWGIFVPPASSVPTGQQAAGTEAAANANPDTTGAAFGAATINGGNILLKSGRQAAAVDTTGAVDPLRLIRQLVYFGRSDPSASISSSLDDSQAGIGGTTVTNATASDGEYKTFPTTQGTVLGTAVATWSVPVPSGSTSSNFFVYAHIPATPTGETRLSHVYYTVTVTGTAGPVTSNVVSISQVTQGTDALVALPTGALSPVAGSFIVVRMYNANGLTTSTNGAVVVADSVTVSTGTGQGAIYCVDGFTGGVIWRYETPGSANGASAPVFASPAIAKINVLVTPPVYSAGGVITTPAVYENRLVAIVGDNNGLVYCLDAIGNGDGTSNVNVLSKTLKADGTPVLDTSGNPVVGPPVTITQPAYGGAYGAVATPLTAGTLATTAAATAHVGTTGVYWVYRPDASQPKYVTGTNIGAVKPIDLTADLPVPAAFNTASPNIFVDPTVPTTVTTTALASNSIVYIGNSNGVLYALDGGGAPIDGTTAVTYARTGDTFNVSQDLQGSVYPEVSIPSAQPLWWFSLRGSDPNSGNNASSADIESAPAIYTKAVTTSTTIAGVTTTSTAYQPTVYIGSAHEMESTSNVGRLYALDGLHGPSGNNGVSSPLTQPVATAANYTGPGSFNYNVGQRPQTSKTDTSDWSFPDAVGTDTHSTGKSSSGKARPALGNITGSPVVFTNIHESAANTNTDLSPRQTRIYVAASSGQEYPATERPDDTLTGRIWAVNLDGSVGTTTNSAAGTWSYPVANDPNNAALDTTAEPTTPMGSFLRATPAIGFVQFPAAIQLNGGATYNPTDAFNTTSILGQTVPMLYVGTRGVNDTALYALDIDGAMTATVDQRTIYRVVSPDGSIFQSSPALITNATTTNSAFGVGVSPGNGGGVYVVAGNTLYDYSATPISNPFVESYPLIRENRAYVGFGPISSPAIAGADTTALSLTFLQSGNGAAGLTNRNGYTTNTTDWVYVGDSSTGLCRGITPNDTSYGGIAVGLGQIVPPDANAPTAVVLNAIMQTFLVDLPTSTASTDSKPIGVSAPLPVYEWGESVNARFSNVAPPNPAVDPKLFVYDTRTYTSTTNPAYTAPITVANASTTNPVPFYTSDGTTAQTVTFSLSDVDVTNTSQQKTDVGSIQPVLSVAPATPLDGFIKDSATTPPSFFPSVVTNLATTDGSRYLGTYTYTIADGTGRNDTPGARRRFQDVKQLVTEYDYTNSLGDGDLTNIANYVKKGTTYIGGDATNQNLVTAKLADGSYGFTQASAIPAVDQPTFGILNPLGVRGGGVPLIPIASPNVAVPIGDELGPFRSVQSPPTLTTTNNVTTTTSGDAYALQALTNGNDVLTVAPPSSSGSTGDPTRRPEGTSDPTGVSTPTNAHVVVTSTGLIGHNTTGDNGEPEATTTAPTGKYSGTTADGLLATSFGSFGLDIFDRSALFNLGQLLRVKMTVPVNVLFAPRAGRDGLYWNSNAINVNGHDSVVNYLPWETPPTPYIIGGNANGSQDYPDIAPGNIVQNAVSINSSSGGDLTSNNVTLPPGMGGAQSGTGSGTLTSVQNRTMIGDPVQIQVSVPHYQPPNQQLYQQTAGQPYDSSSLSQISPVDDTGANQITKPQVFPMGYVTSKRLFVPDIRGNFGFQRPYRDVRVTTGVPIDMRTSVVNPTTDIGKVPAAFGVQTENDPNYGLFTPYNTVFQNYFKPLEIHNDGNVNLLNVHMDQKFISTTSGLGNTLFLNSDSVDPLSFLGGYDIAPAGGTYGVTGPHNGSLPGAAISTQEMPFLIRSSIDTDITQAYGRNPAIANNLLYPNSNAIYPGATFHKPTAGGNQPSTLTVPDDPESYVPGASLDSAPNGVPTIPTANSAAVKAPPYVSLAIPFGTPVGTYSTPTAQDLMSLRLFEGLDTKSANAYSLVTPSTSSIPNYLYPPKYNGAVGGIGTPSSPVLNDVFQSGEPISTVGTQLIGTVLEQRLTDGATFGAVPMIDAQPATGTSTAPVSTPDFAPAAFRDPGTGNLSVYWTSGRGTGGAYGIYGANLPFIKDPTNTTIGQGYFLPTAPAGQWWQPFTPAVVSGPVNSGLSIAPGTASTSYAFDVAVIAAPYNNTLYSYSVAPATGTLSNPKAITSDSSQVKYGVKGLYTGNSFTNSLWAFWTASTGGRTALNYNSQAGGAWQTTSTLLPIPAGLTSVADASPMVILSPVTNGSAAPLAPVIDVTYSGTAPDGNVDLYVSHYQPDATTPSKLDLVPFPAVTENLRPAGGWYQSRDTAWSRTGALNIIINGAPILYSTTNAPLFTRAIYDKASGLLVLTGVKVPQTGTGQPAPTTNTVYVDAATGRIRFSPALLAGTQTFSQLRATFSPMARRLTLDSRADTAPVTFLDDTTKTNDAANVANSTQTVNVAADRRWTIWRKAGVSGTANSATLYYKTQRLTYFLPSAVDVTKAITVTLNGTATTNYDIDYAQGRIYFPIATGAEGGTVAVSYTAPGATTQTTVAADPLGLNTVQWQDEPLANSTAVSPADSAAGLDAFYDNGVPIDTAVNENNVAAFLDPFAGVNSSHKVWLFWNSTRNGTADIYSETIDPRFSPGSP